jgi:hypothetical protein
VLARGGGVGAEQEEEEALLLTVLLIVSPDHQWDAASPQLRALRHAAIHHAPEAVREEVTSLRTQLEALVRYALPRVRFPEQQRERHPTG